MEAKNKMKQAQKQAEDLGKEMMKEGNLKQKVQGAGMWLSGGHDGGGAFVHAIDKIVSSVGDLVKKLDSSVQEIVNYKSD